MPLLALRGYRLCPLLSVAHARNPVRPKFLNCNKPSSLIRLDRGQCIESAFISQLTVNKSVPVTFQSSTYKEYPNSELPFTLLIMSGFHILCNYTVVVLYTFRSRLLETLYGKFVSSGVRKLHDLWTRGWRITGTNMMVRVRSLPQVFDPRIFSQEPCHF